MKIFTVTQYSHSFPLHASVKTCIELTCLWRGSRQHVTCPNLYRAQGTLDNTLYERSRVYGGTLDNTLCVQTCTVSSRVYGGAIDSMCTNLYRAHVYMEGLSTTHVIKLVRSSHEYIGTLGNTLCPNLYRAHVYMEGLSATYYVSKLVQSSRVYGGTLGNILCVQTCTELTCIWRDSRQHM